MSLVALLGVVFVTCLALYAITAIVPAPSPANPGARTLRIVLLLLVVVIASLVILNGIGVFHGSPRLC